MQYVDITSVLPGGIVFRSRFRIKSVSRITFLETFSEGHLCSPVDFSWEVVAEGQELGVSEHCVERSLPLCHRPESEDGIGSASGHSKWSCLKGGTSSVPGFL